MGIERIEVITSVQRRRCWTLAQKLRAVAELNVPGMTVSYVARQYAISPSLLFRWKKLMSEGGKQAIKADDDVDAAAEVRELKKRIRDVRRVLGRKTLEDEILKEVVSVAHEKTDLAVTVLARRGFPVKAVAQTLRVSRSNLVLRRKVIMLKSNLRWASDGFEIPC